MAGNPIVNGVPRYTQDIDLVADLKPEQTELPVSKLNPKFYGDAGQMREALRHERAFKVIDFSTGFKGICWSGCSAKPGRFDMFHVGQDGILRGGW
jgi:hypothetical protein